MAGDWTAIRHDLDDDPNVLAMVAKLPEIVDVDHAIGKLRRFWTWADKHTATGQIPGATHAMIDSIVRMDGFAGFLESVGWLCVSDAGVTVPRFERWMQRRAKKRALTAKRVARHRAKNRKEQSVTGALHEDECNASTGVHDEHKLSNNRDLQPNTDITHKRYKCNAEVTHVTPYSTVQNNTRENINTTSPPIVPPSGGEAEAAEELFSLIGPDTTDLLHDWLGHGRVSTHMLLSVAQLVKDHSAHTVDEGIRICIENNKKTFAYLKAVVENGSQREPKTNDFDEIPF